MQLMETANAELLQEFIGGEITLAKDGSGHGDLLVRGTLMEVIDNNDEWITVKYTVNEYASGTLDDVDTATWHESNGIATWTKLHAKHWVEDGNVVYLDQPASEGSVARITAHAA